MTEEIKVDVQDLNDQMLVRREKNGSYERKWFRSIWN